MKRIVLFLLVEISFAIASAQIKVTVNPANKWVWYAPATPEVQIVVKDAMLDAVSSRISLIVTTDTQLPLCELSQSVNIAKGDSAVLTFQPAITAPGVYKCKVLADGKNVLDFPFNQYSGTDKASHFNIVFEPENIVSLPDYQPDFEEFWNEARKELAQVEPHYEMTELKDKSSKFKKFYLVKMRSLGGDTIQAYLTIPTKACKPHQSPYIDNNSQLKQYPVHIIYMGYGSGVWDLDTSDNGWIQLLLSVRGQALNKPTNKYGDWIQYGLQSPQTYYYRGAYMDCVRAIDFVCTLPEADKSRIYAEGGSQGGAFTTAAAALDNRLAAVATYITFMSDFPDYFKIVDWPAKPIFEKQHELKMTDAEMYRTMSYFDIKNLARWVKCPIFLGVGLQDPTCPPHTNLAGYNLMNVPKQLTIYPHYGHHVDYSHWNPASLDWFDRYQRK